jgi:hypothetical protein
MSSANDADDNCTWADTISSAGITTSPGISVHAEPVKRRSRKYLLGGCLIAASIFVTTSVYFSKRKSRSESQETNLQENSFTNPPSPGFDFDEDDFKPPQTAFPEPDEDDTAEASSPEIDVQTDIPTKEETTNFLDTFAPTEEETELKDFNQATMGPITDLQAWIGGELAAGNTNIVIPQGRYFMEPKQRNGRVHLLFENLVDVTIDGSQAELVCQKTTRAIEINNCTNFSLIGLDIDYDPLPFSQGVITDISEDLLQLTIEMLEGYPDVSTLDNGMIEIYSPQNDKLSTSTYYGVSYQPDITNNKVVVTKQKFQAGLTQESVGDIAVIGSLNIANPIPHAVFANNCTNLKFDSVRVFASQSFGFLETDCSGSRYVNSVVNRRGESWDLYSRGYKRLRSTNADCFHSKHAHKGPSYVGCRAAFSGDDGIAINGHYHIITEAQRSGGRTKLKVIGKLGEVPNLKVGEEAELVLYSGKRIPNAKITAFDMVNTVGLTAQENSFLANQRLAGDVQKTRSATKAYYVTLDREVELPLGSLIASSDRVGNGFEVKNCKIGPLRSRGMVIKASDGEVSGNTIWDTWMHALMFAPVYNWLESGSGNDLVITNNVIQSSHDVAIAVYAEGGDGNWAPAGAHNNVVITNNVITGSSRPAIAVTSTIGLTESGNDISGVRNDLLLPGDRKKWGRNTNASRKVYKVNVQA